MPKRKHTRAILALMLAVAWSWASPVVHAQEADDVAKETDEKPWSRGVSMAQRQAARAIFLEGNRFLQVPLFAQAADKYREALALWPHPAFHYNLAIAQLNLVQPIDAYESLARAMAYGPSALGEREYRQAEEYRQRLEQQLGRVVVACEEPGAEVTLDGQRLFTGPGRYEGMVLPGEHQVVARKPNRIPETRQIVLSPGEHTEVALVLRLPDRVETTRYLPAWVPWVGVGVGAALLSGGGYLDRTSAREVATFDADFHASCPRGCDVPEASDLPGRIEDAEGTWRTAQALYLAGGLVLAGSAALVYINRERVVRREEPKRSISVLPMAGPHTAGVTAWGRF